MNVFIYELLIIGKFYPAYLNKISPPPLNTAQRTCSQSTSYNNTYFVNPGYTGSDTGTGACMLTVNRVNNNICQVRLDFLDLELEQPDADGNCNVDFLTVTGGTSTVPRICGSNTGQHSE